MLKKVILIGFTLILVSCSAKKDTLEQDGTGEKISSDTTKNSLENNENDLTIQMAGSTTVEPIITRINESYLKEFPNSQLTYESIGSSAGIKALLAGNAEMAASSRNLKESEIADGAKGYKIAIDAFAVIIDNKVGIDNLSIQNVADIYNGTITNWSQLNGVDADITIVKRDESSGTYQAFKELFLEKAYPDSDLANYSKNGLTIGSNGEMVTKVIEVDYSIGYIGYAVLEQAVKGGAIPVAIDNIQPTEENLLNGDYTVGRDLYLVTKNEPTAEQQKYIDYTLSEKGQDLVEDAGYLRVN